MFVVRNVANLAPPCEPEGSCACPATAAALEFAVQGLEVRHVVVLGHAGCGGIRAALRPEEEPLSPGDFIGRWMKPLGDAAAEVAARGLRSEAERRTALEHASIRRSIANLRTFPFVSAREDRGRLGLHGAWFDVAEGELWTMDPATGDFSPAG